MPTTPPPTSSRLLLVLAWLAVILPTAWGLDHTIENALKLFHAPAPVTQSTTSSRS